MRVAGIDAHQKGAVHPCINCNGNSDCCKLKYAFVQERAYLRRSFHFINKAVMIPKMTMIATRASHMSRRKVVASRCV